MDSESWVSMLAEIMKTLPSSGSLNSDIRDVEENKRIFSDLVNDLKKLGNFLMSLSSFCISVYANFPFLFSVKKKADLVMLPLECHYLSKPALLSLVGQQPQPTKHFTLKRKPKSAALRAELLQKSTDVQNSVKKSPAPTIPLRSRGMPRKVADTSMFEFQYSNTSNIHWHIYIVNLFGFQLLLRGYHQGCRVEDSGALLLQALPSVEHPLEKVQWKGRMVVSNCLILMSNL